MPKRFSLLLLLLLLLLFAGGRRPVGAQSGRTVLAFYYAWYDPGSFGPGKTPFQPLHPYHSSSATTIRRHVNTARAAGIDGFVQSWYGPDASQQTETNFRTLLAIGQETNFKAAVHFESASPWFGNNQARADALKTLLNTHAKHPAYLKKDGKPVIFFWANWILSVQEWRTIRDQVDPQRTSIWIAEGGHVEYLSVFDGLHLYNVAWSAAPGGVNATWAERTRQAAQTYGGRKYWAATAMPGFDNSLVRGVEHTVRRRGNGSYLRNSFNGAAATNPDWLLLTSFNEWREGSGIEPSHEFGNLYINLMAELAAGFKGVSPGSFPPLPAWQASAPPARQAAPTAVPPPTNTPQPAPTQITNSFAPANSGVSAQQAVAQAATQPPTVIVATIQPSPTPLQGGEIVYEVQEGDTLLAISLRFNIALEELRALNGLGDSDMLRPGQLLLLGFANNAAATAVPQATATETPQPTATVDLSRASPTPASDGRITYVVQPGDTLVSIAVRYDLTLDTLYELNGLNQSSLLSVGQTLLLGRDQGAVVPIEGNIPPRFEGAELREEDNAFVHVVQPNETLIEIAVQYGYQTMDEFYEVSGLDGDSLLQLGQQVVVGYKPVPEDVGGSTDLPTETPTNLPPPPPTNTPLPPPSATPLPFPEPADTATTVPTETAIATEAAVLVATAEVVPAEPPEAADESSLLLPLALVGLVTSLGVVGVATWWLLSRRNS